MFKKKVTKQEMFRRLIKEYYRLSGDLHGYFYISETYKQDFQLYSYGYNNPFHTQTEIKNFQDVATDQNDIYDILSARVNELNHGLAKTYNKRRTVKYHGSK